VLVQIASNPAHHQSHSPPASVQARGIESMAKSRKDIQKEIDALQTQLREANLVGAFCIVNPRPFSVILLPQPI
jgi:hypothetical protein